MRGVEAPDALIVVRHGESAGNVARDLAEAEGHAMIGIATRDMDVPLSALGERQAAALGRWLARLAEHERPTAMVTSPYVRARETGRLALEEAGLLDRVVTVCDERLREREFGILDRLTKAGIGERHPEQAAARAFLGKFYHRPPGGESWCDVILRLRGVVDTLTRDFVGERVLVVTHQVVVLMFRYLLERMTEEEILAIDRREEVANCSVTSYERDAAAGGTAGLALRRFNFVAPLEEAGEVVTSEPDVPAGPR